MKLTKVTFTGIDATTDPKRLVELQEAYPFAEFGILMSYDWRENGNRYLDPSLLPLFSDLGLNLSAHLCGQAALDLVLGKHFKVRELFGSNSRIFRRCQLNIRWHRSPAAIVTGLRKLSPVSFVDEVILQMHTPELCRLFLQGEHPKNMAFLLDGSGGTGKDTPVEIVTSPGVHIGYAGGIKPTNVRDKLIPLLDCKAKERFWIDMESGVRNADDLFDLEKVETVLNICSALLKERKLHE